MTYIKIPHPDNQSAIVQMLQIGGKLAQNCWIDPDNTLRVNLGLAEQVMIDNMDQSIDRMPDEPDSMPTRFDRVIPLTIEQSSEWLTIGHEFARQYNQAVTLEEKRSIVGARDRTSQQFRYRVIKPHIEADLPADRVEAVIFGGDFPTSIESPDGMRRYCTMLVHASHPTSAEELYLREAQTVCQRIFRYRIPGVDDAEWIRQEEPREPLDVAGWRRLIN